MVVNDRQSVPPTGGRVTARGVALRLRLDSSRWDAAWRRARRRARLRAVLAAFAQVSFAFVLGFAAMLGILAALYVWYRAELPVHWVFGVRG